jgi:hypothetical protein
MGFARVWKRIRSAKAPFLFIDGHISTGKMDTKSLGCTHGIYGLERKTAGRRCLYYYKAENMVSLLAFFDSCTIVRLEWAKKQKQIKEQVRTWINARENCTVLDP